MSSDSKLIRIPTVDVVSRAQQHVADVAVHWTVVLDCSGTPAQEAGVLLETHTCLAGALSDVP